MGKIKKEKSYKREYIPVVLASFILLLLIALLVLVFINEPKDITIEINKDNVVNVEELQTNTDKSKCSKDNIDALINEANKVSAEYNAKLVLVDIPESDYKNFEKEVLEKMNYKWYERKIVISINNLSKNMIVEISNDYNDKKILITSADIKDGTYTFYGETLNEIVNYYVSIKASNDECMGEEIRKVSFRTLIFNVWSDHLACTTYPKYTNCKRLVEKEISYDTFDIGLEKYKKTNKEEAKQGEENALKAFYNVYEIAQIEKKQEEEKVKQTEREKQLIKDRKLIIISLIIIGIGVLVIILLSIIRRYKI